MIAQNKVKRRCTILPVPGSGGFTLIEIILAVLLLGTALTVILGLQTSAVTQAVDDSNREFAILNARHILAQIEGDTGDLEERDEEKELSEMLGDFKVLGSQELNEQKGRLAQYRAHLTIKAIGIPDVADKAMKQVSLQIAWGDGARQFVEVYYFAPIP